MRYCKNQKYRLAAEQSVILGRFHFHWEEGPEPSAGMADCDRNRRACALLMWVRTWLWRPPKHFLLLSSHERIHSQAWRECLSANVRYVSMQNGQRRLYIPDELPTPKRGSSFCSQGTKTLPSALLLIGKYMSGSLNWWALSKNRGVIWKAYFVHKLVHHTLKPTSARLSLFVNIVLFNF